MALYDDDCSGVLNRVHAQLLHVLPSSLFAMSSKCVSDVMVKWKMKSWTVTRVIMWLLCDHGVDASKDWVFVAHFIHLFNTTMPMSCTDVHSGAPISHFLHRRVGMGCQALNFLSRGNYVTGDPLHSRALAHSRAPLFTQPCPHCSHSRAPGEQWARLCVFTLQGCVQAARLCRGSPVYVFKMARMHACLQNVQPLYKTFNAPALWKTCQVWVSSAARQERPSMFFNFTKIILVNIWILN